VKLNDYDRVTIVRNKLECFLTGWTTINKKEKRSSPCVREEQ